LLEDDRGLGIHTQHWWASLKLQQKHIVMSCAMQFNYVYQYITVEHLRQKSDSEEDLLEAGMLMRDGKEDASLEAVDGVGRKQL
jgi:hypothetical protein